MAVTGNAELDTIELLLAFGADPDGGFSSGASLSSTPLHHAIQFRREALAILLVASGADIRAADHVRGSHRNLTVLQLAASIGLVEVVRLLLDHGADPQAAQGDSPIPLCLAIMENKMEVVDLMRTARGDR